MPGKLHQVMVDGIRKTKRFSDPLEGLRWERETRDRLTHKTLYDALERYLSSVTPLKKSSRWETNTIHRLQAHRIAHKALNRLTATDLSEWRDSRLQTVSGSTVNRELNVLSAVLHVARREWGWMDQTISIKRPKENKPRTKLPTEDEINRLCEALGGDLSTVSGRVGLAYQFALETALRAGEIARLRPEHIVGRTVILFDTKNGTDRVVPLSEKAHDLLLSCNGNFQLTSSQITSMFAKAKRNCLVDTTFHDSRAYALTKLSKKVNVLTLAKISGHKDLRILMEHYYREDMGAVAKLL